MSEQEAIAKARDAIDKAKEAEKEQIRQLRDEVIAKEAAMRTAEGWTRHDSSIQQIMTRSADPTLLMLKALKEISSKLDRLIELSQRQTPMT